MLGADNVREIPPVMGGEDFSFFAERVPGVFVFLAVGDERSGASVSCAPSEVHAQRRRPARGRGPARGFALRSLDELPAQRR